MYSSTEFHDEDIVAVNRNQLSISSGFLVLTGSKCRHKKSKRARNDALRGRVMESVPWEAGTRTIVCTEKPAVRHDTRASLQRIVRGKEATNKTSAVIANPLTKTCRPIIYMWSYVFSLCVC
jgi:hypothetical protein